MTTKIKNYRTKTVEFVQKLGDIRFTGQIVFVVIVLLITWSGVKAVQTNYGLQKQISALKQQNQLQELENNNLDLQNQYYSTNQYLELSARQNFGLGLPGENEVVVPPKVALAYTVDVPTQTDPTASIKQPAYQSNLQSWVNFFLHRQSNN
jgi:cell division protein FtsL